MKLSACTCKRFVSISVCHAIKHTCKCDTCNNVYIKVADRRGPMTPTELSLSTAWHLLRTMIAKSDRMATVMTRAGGRAGPMTSCCLMLLAVVILMLPSLEQVREEMTWITL